MHAAKAADTDKIIKTHLKPRAGSISMGWEADDLLTKLISTPNQHLCVESRLLVFLADVLMFLLDNLSSKLWLIYMNLLVYLIHIPTFQSSHIKGFLHQHKWIGWNKLGNLMNSQAFSVGRATPGQRYIQTFDIVSGSLPSTEKGIYTILLATLFYKLY